MAKRQNLGRGLDALLGEPFAESLLADAQSGELRNLPLEMIQRGRFQPRTQIDPERLTELADSIRAQGVVQPIVVRPRADDRQYEIIAGERRWRAAQMAGLTEIPALVRNCPDEAVVAIALIENVQRENLNPIEEAFALKRLTDEFGMTHDAAAKAVGRSRTAVTNLLRLLELTEQVKSLVQQGGLEMGHARALLGLPDPLQYEAARQVVAKGLSARETERLVRRLKSGPAATKATDARPDADVRRLETTLSERLGAEVHIQQTGRGQGQLVIRYHSLEELDGILARIQ
nr:ParB/RepB/Spo0J family partition protein [Gammaproteobacteria bacterium]